MSALPFSQACENNKSYILEVLRDAFADRLAVLEIGAGTGQHATFLAERMPWLTWQPTDVAQNLLILNPRCAEYAGDNLLPPVALDVCEDPWPVAVPDAVFTANSLHIMPFGAVQRLFAMLGRSAPEGTVLAVYGPFNYNGCYTSDSNAQFDQWLAHQHPESAIRHFESVDELAKAAGFTLRADNAMPANNRLLVWQRTSVD